MQATMQRPAMKWVGSKMGTPVIDRVAELYAPFRDRVWVEPFVGIGGALLAIDPELAICMDASTEVVGLHRWIQDGGKYFPFEIEWSESDYKVNRECFQGMQSRYKGQIAMDGYFFSLMLWLNRACFNGLWRVNSQGLFNVPVGKNSKGELPRFKEPTLPKYRRDWTFNLSGCSIPDYTNAFVYADPPYWGTHSAYTAKGFRWDDQVELANNLASLGCPVVASNSSEPGIINLYGSLGFTLELIPVRRSISCKGGDRKAAVEMLAHKNCGEQSDG